MRRVGRISGWRDDKGFGFVVPHDGGDRAFVHIKAFQFASRRPAEGDLISYSTSKDARGRTNAIEVRFAGQKFEERRPAAALPRMAFGALFLVAVLLAALFGLIPAALTFDYLLFSCVSYIFYSLDKIAAGKNMRRTPESALHFLDLLGGWPGALIAQQHFRHKTAKVSFQSVFWLTVLVNIVVAAWSVHSGVARFLTSALFGS